MNIRKTLLTMSAAVALSVGTMTPASAAAERQVVVNIEALSRLSAEDQKHVNELATRMNTLLATDRSGMNKAERRALRGELRELKDSMDFYNERAGGTVIYISTAGLVLLIILLVILL